MTEKKVPKYFKFASVWENRNDKGEEYTSVTLDTYNLVDNLKLLNEYYTEHIEGKTPQEVKDGMKAKTIPKFYLNFFSPFDGPNTPKNLVQEVKIKNPECKE